MIKFTNNTDIGNEVMNKINKLTQENIYFNSIMFQINNDDDILIHICTESDLLNDIHNKTRTLTQFRGYNLMNNIYVFYTRYETIDSLTSLLLHELCHYILGKNQLTINLVYLLNGGFLKEKGIINDFKEDYTTMLDFEQLTTKDEIHENLIEERLCDYFAKTIIGENYDRLWWRENIKKVDGYNK